MHRLCKDLTKIIISQSAAANRPQHRSLTCVSAASFKAAQPAVIGLAKAS